MLLFRRSQRYSVILGYSIDVVVGHVQKLGGAAYAQPALPNQLNGVYLRGLIEPLAQSYGPVGSLVPAIKVYQL
jgi:hypothetical protein